MADTEVETTMYTIESAEGDSDEIELPVQLVDMLSEEGDTRSTVVGDMALLSFAQQAHAIVHHGHGEADEALEAIEERTLDLFEERFGVSFGEATGHSH